MASAARGELKTPAVADASSLRSEVPLLLERFARVVRAHPGQVAVEVPPAHGRPERVRWTYAELDRAATDLALATADALARTAGGRDASEERIVAIALARDTPHLYAAQLAAMRAGAAFTCLDPKFPADHVQAILDDAGVDVILTDSAGAGWLASLGVRVGAVIDVTSLADLRDRGNAVTGVPSSLIDPLRLAYLIYTSGTTGRPKGVEIEHRSIANLVDSDVERFGLGPADRVAQCSSPAYDSSLEETWLAFAVGATLVPLDDETVRLGPDLVPWLQRERITVLCPPPTLLRTTGCDEPDRALPLLRFLYVGGEALPQDLADRWGKGRWLENGYGPTECTVTVVRTRIEPGREVTIGQPVRGNRAWIVDEELDEVADGELGELCMAGISLARGYRGLPDVTSARFVEHPRYGRIYRTGDLVRRRPDGDIEYHGRIDAQVKLRGYRVELGAVEACIAAFPGVREAACRVQGSASAASAQILVAHVVADDDSALPDPDLLREHCRRALPSYMVPSRFAFRRDLPRSVGGKLDRKALPDVAASEGAASGRSLPIREASSDLERLVVDAFASSLHQAPSERAAISIDDDFFLALGGDSLSAVGVICALRAHPSLANVTVRDLYTARTAEALAARCEAIAKAHQGPSAAPAPHREREVRSPARATMVQAGFLTLSVAITGWVWWFLAFELVPFLTERFTLVGAALVAPAFATIAAIAWVPIAVRLTALAQRTIIGRSVPGRYPVWSAGYVRYWLVEQIARLVPWGMLEGTVLYGLALRALGARIGNRVHVHRGVALGRGAWDLLSIGDDVTLAQEATLHVMDVDDGALVIAPIAIGARATIGVRAGVGGGAVVGIESTLRSLAYLPNNAVIPPGEAWDGVPAACVGRSTDPPAPRDRGWNPYLHAWAMLGSRVLRSLAVGVPLAAAVALSEWFAEKNGSELLRWFFVGEFGWRAIVVMTILSLISVPVGLLGSAILLRLMGRIRTGTMHRFGADALRVWAKSAIVDGAGRWLSGSIYWPIWLRLAGMRIGRGCEISTIIDVVPEAVELGNESFFADGIYFCSPDVHRGTITLGATRLGSDTFLGNHAVVPGGASYPDGMFIGVATVADAARARPNTGWFGHPAMELPRREVVSADRSVTHNPSWIRIASRVFWESLRFALPVVPATVFLGWLHGLEAASTAWSPLAFVLIAIPVTTFAALATLAMVILAMKWTLLGRVKPGQHPLWSCWCSRWDFLFVAWSMYARGLLERLEGTIFLTWFLRAIGMRIGKNVVLGDGFAQVVDPDMLTFEDGATVTCNFQAHTFEDRILKIDHLVIRKNATVGHHTVVFYGADIGEEAHVEPHSVVMKQETLVAGGVYAGCPAARLG